MSTINFNLEQIDKKAFDMGATMQSIQFNPVNNKMAVVFRKERQTRSPFFTLSVITHDDHKTYEFYYGHYDFDNYEQALNSAKAKCL